MPPVVKTTTLKLLLTTIIKTITFGEQKFVQNGAFYFHLLTRYLQNLNAEVANFGNDVNKQ